MIRTHTARMNPFAYFSRILGVHQDMLEDLEEKMRVITGKRNVFEELAERSEAHILHMLKALQVTSRDPDEVTKALGETVEAHERQLVSFLERVQGATHFERMKSLARRVGRVQKGFFLKRAFAEEILRQRLPKNLLAFFGYTDIAQLFAHHDVTEAFSALRFMESDAWMHETFEVAYSHFTPDDFEERSIEIRVLGPQWQEVAKQFVEKKHHNVSHLKEFGVIFLNPIAEDVPGKFLRDFALLFHYSHEIVFYSKLFTHYAAREDFAEQLKALLRGDVRELRSVRDGEWLIVQRYLYKENPSDPRLFLPRINPESMHWARAERDLVEFGRTQSSIDLELWNDLDWVGTFFGDKLISLDLEDTTMSRVSFHEGAQDFFPYHHREALWTKLFLEYAGGEETAEKLLVENFRRGVIQFEK